MANNAFNANAQDEFLFDGNNFPNNSTLAAQQLFGDVDSWDIIFDPLDQNNSTYQLPYNETTASFPYNPVNWSPIIGPTTTMLPQPSTFPPSLRTDFSPLTTGGGLTTTESPMDIDIPMSANISPTNVNPARSATVKGVIQTKKRLPLLKDGYQCDVAGCTKVCDRNGDLQKHKKRTHTPEEQRPHGCPQCKKRFLWRKDLTRHKRQVHSGRSSSSSSSSSASSRTGSSALIQFTGMPRLNLNMLSSNGRPARVGSIDEVMNIILNTIRTRRVAIRLRARRRSSILASADAARRFVMITRDGLNFRAVDIAQGSASPKALGGVLRAALGMSESSAVPLPLAPFALGKGVVGSPLSSGELFETIFPGPTATPSPVAGSLQFWLSAPLESRVVEDVEVF